MRDFFISYNHRDEKWAGWIASTLKDAGYTHYFQKWNFRPGGNFVLLMDKAASDSKRTLLVLSNNYLGSLYTQPEWAAAFAKDPTGERRSVVPIRIERCEVVGLLATVISFDLFDLNADQAKIRLLEGLRAKARREPRPAFPGPANPTSVSVDPVRAAAADLYAVLKTTRATFEAQIELRNKLSEKMHKRMRIMDDFEYEELFEVFFERLSPAELRLHRTIREYTKSVLRKYNKRALDIIQNEPRLEEFLPSYSRLQHHLIVWLEKYRFQFHHPFMCLLYVGVEENARFPNTMDAELAHYLQTGKRPSKLEIERKKKSKVVQRKFARESRE
jgi:hypothetical protein